MRRIAARPDLWTPLVVIDRDRRRYDLLYDDDQVDIWVLSWMPGQRPASTITIAPPSG